MNGSYEEIPLPKSEFGRRAYEEGRSLVEREGIELSEVVWDADEVLWDWVMDAGRILRDVSRLITRDIGHREYFMVKPGIFEMIWGMHHACLERDWDPHMRIWTNGYPWRLWRLAREIPGFADLVGPPASAAAADEASFSTHPRIFCRPDFVEVMSQLLDDADGRGVDRFGEPVRAVIEKQLGRDPYDSSFKIPELAEIHGKPGFGDAQILVDDHRRNVDRFASTGRAGVRVVSDIPRTLFGRVPNTVWSRPMETLESLENNVATAVADGLRRAAGGVEATIEAHPEPRPPSHPVVTFTVDIPDQRLREEWIEPMRRLKRRDHEIE